MECKSVGRDKNCFIPIQEEEITFDVESFSDTYAVIDEYMTGLFGANVNVEFENTPNLVDICETQLIKALKDYDKFILASKLYEDSDIRQKVLEWAPEFEEDLKANLVFAVDKEVFNIQGFYTFCDMDLPNEKREDPRYLFCGLERSDNLDKLIIGLWVRNHEPFGDMLAKFYSETYVQK